MDRAKYMRGLHVHSSHILLILNYFSINYLDCSQSPIEPLFHVTRAWIAAAKGELEVARAAVMDHQKDEWLNGAYDPYFISLCALAGEHDLAINLLERQVTWAGSYRYLVSDPNLKPLRGHPRFQELLRRRYKIWTRLTDRMHTIPVPPPKLEVPDGLK